MGDMVPIVIFIVWIGVYPSTFLKISENSTRLLVNKIELLKFGKSTYELPGYDNPAENQETE